MVYPYQLSVSTNIIPIKNVLLLASDTAAKLYLDRVYDYYTDIIVLSANGGYPTDATLRDRTLAAVKCDTSINLIMLGCDSVTYITPATEKILMLDDLIISDAAANKRKPGMDLDERKLALMIRSFVDQDKKLKMGNNFSNGYSNYREYASRGWMHQLLI
jgi:hypothetical protein